MADLYKCLHFLTLYILGPNLLCTMHEFHGPPVQSRPSSQATEHYTRSFLPGKLKVVSARKLTKKLNFLIGKMMGVIALIGLQLEVTYVTI